MEIKFKRLVENAVLPLRGTDLAAGVDLTLTENLSVSNKAILAPTGIAVAIPEGYVGLLVGRSSLAIKHGVQLANCMGVIDSDYRGEIKVPLIYHGEPQVRSMASAVTMDHSIEMMYPSYKIDAGTRIAQLLIMKCTDSDLKNFTFVESEDLDETVRGDGGFGSTGQ